MCLFLIRLTGFCFFLMRLSPNPNCSTVARSARVSFPDLDDGFAFSRCKGGDAWVSTLLSLNHSLVLGYWFVVLVVFTDEEAGDNETLPSDG